MLVVGSDHAGFKLKSQLIDFLIESGYECEDCGTYSEDACDYPVIAHKVGNMVSSKQASYGILVCGSGIGVSIASNKVKGVRAALCYTPELASLARKHNDANIVCLASRFIDVETAKSIVKEFLTTEFEGGRHLKRVNKIEID